MPLAGVSSPAAAEDAPNELAETAKKALKIITTGADEVYDPSSEAGAKALGLAFPVPKLEKLEKVGLEDFLPLVGILLFATLWGIFVVPAVLDRSDGSKAYAFAEAEEELPDAKAVEMQAPVLQVKRPVTTSEDLTPVVSSQRKVAPRSKKQGFAKKGKRVG